MVSLSRFVCCVERRDKLVKVMAEWHLTKLRWRSQRSSVCRYDEEKKPVARAIFMHYVQK